MQTSTSVYVGMAADIIHPGHINLLNHAAELGSVTVGLLTDEAIRSYKAEPTMSYDERHVVVASLRQVEGVIPQLGLDYRPNLRRLQPRIVVHGDDWRSGPQRAVRQQILDILHEWGGTLIEIPYFAGISSSDVRHRILMRGCANV